MAKKKTLDQLRAEKEQVEIRLAQEQHKLSRLENRKKYYEKGERAKRTHELCNIGGAVESLFSLPEVRNTLHSFESRQEDREHGIIPSDRNTD